MKIGGEDCDMDWDSSRLLAPNSDHFDITSKQPCRHVNTEFEYLHTGGRLP